MGLCIRTEQFQNDVLNFFVVLLIYGIIHQNKAISEQSSKFLCTTDDYEVCIITNQIQNKVLNFFVIRIIYGAIHQNKAISERGSEFLCVTDDLWSCVYDKADSD